MPWLIGPGTVVFLLPPAARATLAAGVKRHKRFHEMCQPADIRPKSVSAEELAHIAHLARLALDSRDIPRLREELARILTLVDEMNAVDTADLEPMAHPVEMEQHLRSDEVREPDQRELLQRGAPEVEDGLYLVPRVIE